MPMTHRISLLDKIAWFLAVLMLCVGNATIALPQDKSKEKNKESKALAKLCNPSVVKHLKVKQTSIQIRKGEKSSGFTPLIAFQIAESGEVINAHVKRSSGIRDVDDYALNSIKSTKYNARPGCPVIESEASVNIDWAADSSVK
jgi:TonB family protein